MLNSEKTVTIGVPLFNEKKYIAETLKSLLNQTYKNILVYVSDNCSDDGSADEVKNIMQTDNRIKLFVQKENIGATANFKYLAENANTEFFMWIGAHDIISETYIEESVNILSAEPETVLVYHKAIFFYDNIINTGEFSYSEIDTIGLSKVGRLIKVFNKTGSCTAVHGVFRTSVVKLLPFAKIIGPDHLMLFASACFGQIRQINKVGFFRRQTRKTETVTQRRNRYKSYKMYNFSRFSPLFKFTFEHLKYVFNISGLGFLSKMYISANIILRVTTNYIVFELLRIKK